MVKKLKMKQIQEIKKRYLDGESSEKLSLEYPVSSVAIRGILKRRNIRIRDQSHSGQTYMINEEFFEEINAQEKAYWLGFICADGYLNLERNALAIVLSIKDKGHLTKFLKSINSSHPIKFYKVKGYEYAKVYLGNKKLGGDLKKYMGKNKTFSLRFPTIKKELENDFIRGYFDGDGSISKNKFNNPSFSITSNIDFLKELKKKFINLNQDIKIYQNKKNKKIGELRYSGRGNIKKIYEFLYSDSTIYLNRKKERFENVIKN